MRTSKAQRVVVLGMNTPLLWVVHTDHHLHLAYGLATRLKQTRRDTRTAEAEKGYNKATKHVNVNHISLAQHVTQKALPVIVAKVVVAKVVTYIVSSWLAFGVVPQAFLVYPRCLGS